MKYSIFFILILCLACNQFKPNKYTPVTSKDMEIIAEKMAKGILPGKKGSYGSWYYTASFPEAIASGAIVTYNCDDKIFRIDISTLDEGPGLGGIIDVDTTGKIIRAWGFSRDTLSCNSYYSEYWTPNKNTSKEAKEFYIGVVRMIVTYIKDYKPGY